MPKSKPILSNVLSEPQTTPTGNKPVYENKNYKIVVGVPPATEQIPHPIPAYLIVNKETGVTETWNGILFYAKQNADTFNDLLEGKDPHSPFQLVPLEAAEEIEGLLPGEKKSKGSFN